MYQEAPFGFLDSHCCPILIALRRYFLFFFFLRTNIFVLKVLSLKMSFTGLAGFKKVQKGSPSLRGMDELCLISPVPSRYANAGCGNCGSHTLVASSSWSDYFSLPHTHWKCGWAESEKRPGFPLSS